MSTTTINLDSFGQDHFGAAYLGDQRRTCSLVDLANRFAQHPGGTLPDKCQDPLALRRCYDLMHHPAVTHARVLEPHRQRTLRLIRQQPEVVLLLHDTTELDLTGHLALGDELGQIGNGSRRGYLCHNSLAVGAESRTVLGLVGQLLHVRADVPAKETPSERRDRESRESLLWLQAVDGIVAATRISQRQASQDGPPAGRSVDICDRGGDTFEFLDHEDVLGRTYVIRSKHNRRMRRGHEGTEPIGLLHDYLRTLLEQSRRTITLPERDGHRARSATVALAWAAVQVLPPENHCGTYRQRPLAVWALRVWEVDPPAGVEGVEWFLLTNVAVASVADAWERVDWYCKRWIIEEFHKAQKTGCAIETPQFTKAARLQPMIALLSVVAVLLLNLRDLSRDSATQAEPATTVVDEEYVAVLSGWRYREQRPLSVREFFLALARLGGHQNRRGDGEPGWLVLWRGWSALQLMVAGARAARQPRAAPKETKASRRSSRQLAEPDTG
jgi:hypothetical protein